MNILQAMCVEVRALRQVTLGKIAGFVNVTRLIGRARALELAVGGQLVDAKVAERYGLVNRARGRYRQDGVNVRESLGWGVPCPGHASRRLSRHTRTPVASFATAEPAERRLR
jgi:enoyl-CoA hydratase/carnithine racemase